MLLLLVLGSCSANKPVPQYEPFDFVSWTDAGVKSDNSEPLETDSSEPIEQDTTQLVHPCYPETPPGTVRAYFSKNVSYYSGELTLCAGQDLGLRAAELIDQAESTIDMAAMGIQHDDVLEALMEASSRGVKVRVVMDDEYYRPDEWQDLVDLEDSGVDLVTDTYGSPYMHNKFIIVDSTYLWTGSANFSSYDSTSNANSTLLFNSEAICGVYQNRFDRMWGDGTVGSGDCHQDQFGYPKNVTINSDKVDVYFTPSWSVAERYKELIANAEEAIHFQIFAFTLDEIREAILDRCGEVEIIGLYDEDQATSYGSTIPDYWCDEATILPANVIGGSGYKKMHQKLLLIDPTGSKPFIATGSFNWTNAASESNDENVVILSDPELAELFEAEFQARLAQSR